jgi:hypothetical protein
MKERFGQGISQSSLLQLSLTEEVAHGVDVTVSAFAFWFAFWKVWAPLHDVRCRLALLLLTLN